MPILNTFLRETRAVRNVINADVIKVGSRANDIGIENVKMLSNKTPNPVLIFDFVYKAVYELIEPKDQALGEIAVRGEIYYTDKKEVIEKIHSKWQKDKALDEDIMTKIINVALNKAQIEAIEQSAKIGLPTPVPLPLKTQSIKPVGKHKGTESAAA